MKTVILTLLAATVAALTGAAIYVRTGAYDISATAPHTGIVYRLLETTMHHSVRVRAEGLQAPPLREPERLALGAACYRNHCVQCHGGPGVAQGDLGKSLQPLPGPLMDAARRWRPEEVYWITRHGIKMSGMPAWEFRLTDEELWAVVAFVDHLAELSPAAYAQAVRTVAPDRCVASDPAATADLRPLQPRSADQHARLLLQQYACIACHQVPGLVGPETHVGPPLEDHGRRATLPGGLPNTTANLARWLREPQALRSGTAMPDMGVSEEHARILAEFLNKNK